MRTTIGWVGAMGVAAMLACACGGPNTGDGRSVDLPPRSGSDGTGAVADDEGGGGGDDTLVPTGGEDQTGAEQAPAPQEQTFCDDAKTIPGVKLLDEPLSTDTAKFVVAPGFTTTSWTFADDAYRQTRLADAGDATFFAGDAAVGDVDVEVVAASTDVTSAISPRLRQMFILVGATSAAGTLDAYGCGAEVVQGMSPEQRTSVVRLSGSADAVTTTPIERTARTILKEGEPFSMRAKLANGTLTCTVSQGADVVTSAQATGLANVKGAIGFFTRQTKAAFKNVKACKLGTAASTPK